MTFRAIEKAGRYCGQAVDDDGSVSYSTKHMETRHKALRHLHKWARETDNLPRKTTQHAEQK